MQTFSWNLFSEKKKKTTTTTKQKQTTKLLCPSLVLSFQLSVLRDSYTSSSTWSSTRQRWFELWLFLRACRHTPQAFWETLLQAGYVLLESDSTRSDHKTRNSVSLLFSNSVGSSTSLYEELQDRVYRPYPWRLESLSICRQVFLLSYRREGASPLFSPIHPRPTHHYQWDVT